MSLFKPNLRFWLIFLKSKRKKDLYIAASWNKCEGSSPLLWFWNHQRNPNWENWTGCSMQLQSFVLSPEEQICSYSGSFILKKNWVTNTETLNIMKATLLNLLRVLMFKHLEILAFLSRLPRQEKEKCHTKESFVTKLLSIMWMTVSKLEHTIHQIIFTKQSALSPLEENDRC